MSSHSLAATVAAVACALVVPLGAGAQQARAVSLDLNVGFEAVRTSGEYRDPRQGPAVDAMLAMRLATAERGAIVAGVGAGAPWAWSSTTECLPASTGGCMQTSPGFLRIGALVGWENRSTTLRALVGPAYVSVKGRGTFGFQGRLDGAIPIVRQLALVASLRGMTVPNYRGDAFGVYSFGLGIRIR